MLAFLEEPTDIRIGMRFQEHFYACALIKVIALQTLPQSTRSEIPSRRCSLRVVIKCSSVQIDKKIDGGQKEPEGWAQSHRGNMGRGSTSNCGSKRQTKDMKSSSLPDL